MTHELITYVVVLDTPKGQGSMDVPSMLGPDAAGRRAVVAACGQGWGDFDNITVASITEEEA